MKELKKGLCCHFIAMVPLPPPFGHFFPCCEKYIIMIKIIQMHPEFHYRFEVTKVNSWNIIKENLIRVLRHRYSWLFLSVWVVTIKVLRKTVWTFIKYMWLMTLAFIGSSNDPRIPETNRILFYTDFQFSFLMPRKSISFETHKKVHITYIFCFLSL